MLCFYAERPERAREAHNPAFCHTWLDGLSDQEPDHVCYEVARASTEEMMSQRILYDSRLLLSYSVDWPLPVGSKAITIWLKERVLAFPDRYSIPQPTVVLKDDAWLGLAARRQTDTGCTWLLGLVEPLAPVEPDFPGVWQFVEPLLLTESCTTKQAGLNKLASVSGKLLRWYRKVLLGKQIGGRPEGSIAMPDFPERYRDVYRHWVQNRGDRPRQSDIAAELSLSERAFRDYLLRFGLCWPPD